MSGNNNGDGTCYRVYIHPFFFDDHKQEDSEENSKAKSACTSKVLFPCVICLCFF